MRGRASRWWSRVPAAVMAVALMTAAPPLTATSTASAASTAEPDWAALSRCHDFTYSVVELTADGFVVNDPVGDTWGQEILTEPLWAAPPDWDVVKLLHAYGMPWIVPLLEELRDSGSVERLDPLVESVAATLVWRPDTGLQSDPAWGEAAVTRRMEALLCLHDVTEDARLLPLMTSLGVAASDPARYYGPPLRRSHNHGLMANIALIGVGRVLGRDDFVSLALDRMRIDIDGAFTPLGHTIEQSSYYHVGNVELWRKVATEVLDPSAADLSQHIHDVLARADSVTSYLAMPDGRPVPFGDMRGDPVAVSPQPSLTFTDLPAGVLTGRWSWSGATEWYAARFGGKRYMHGHHERGSLVWWSRGRPILADPVTGTYVPGPLKEWTLSPYAHSVATVRGMPFDPFAGVALRSQTVGPGAHELVLQGRPYGVKQVRQVTIDPAAHRLTIRDSAERGRLTVLLQLDPRWILRSQTGTSAVLVDARGARVVLTTTGTVASVLRGGDGFSGGWVWEYPPPDRTPATRVVISGGSSVTTTLTVYGVPAAPQPGPVAPAATAYPLID